MTPNKALTTIRSWSFGGPTAIALYPPVGVASREYDRNGIPGLSIAMPRRRARRRVDVPQAGTPQFLQETGAPQAPSTAARYLCQSPSGRQCLRAFPLLEPRAFVFARLGGPQPKAGL